MLFIQIAFMFCILSVCFTAPHVYKKFKTEKPLHKLLLFLTSFLPFLVSYLYLVSLTQKAYFGIFYTAFYLTQYLYCFFAITVFQKHKFTASLYGLINGFLLFSLTPAFPLGNSTQRGGWITFSWDWLIELPIIFFAFINYIVCLIYISIKIVKHTK